jgi:hypothetical protein
MAIVFAWDDWNKEHVKKHGSNEADARFIVEHAEAPFPREIGDGKYLVWGKTSAEIFVEVIFAFRLPEDLEFASLTFLEWCVVLDYHADIAIYICHAMPMTDKQIRQFRKLRRNP